jgi:hypothetical protein
VAERENLARRVNALSDGARKYLAAHWPHGLPTLKQQPNDWELMRIEQLVSDVETRDSAPFNDVPLPAEGDILDIGTYRHIEAVYQTLDDPIKTAVDYFLQAAKPGVAMGTFARTVRRFEILRMLIYVAEFCRGDVTMMGTIIEASTLGRITKEQAESVANEYSEKLHSESESVQQ